MGDRDLMILLVYKDIRENLQRLRSLVGEDIWAEDENLRDIDAALYLQEQKAYNNLIQTTEQKKTELLKDSIDTCE